MPSESGSTGSGMGCLSNAELTPAFVHAATGETRRRSHFCAK